MKRLSRLIQHHAERYREALERRWAETDLSEGEMRQIVRRMEGVLEQLPAAIRQAHERIIGGRLVKNEEKLLSLYERELHVIVRGKANAEVEKDELVVEITEVNPFAGGHPVPPLPGQVLVEPNANKQGVLNG